MEQDQILANLGIRMIAIGRMKVADVRRGIFIRLVTQRPANLDGALVRVNQFNMRRTEEWHGKTAREMNLCRIEAHIDREGFDQVLPVVPIVERAGPEKERNGCVD